MQEEIFKFVSTTFGVSAAVTLALLLCAFWLTHWLTKRVTEIRLEHAGIKADHDRQAGSVATLEHDMAHCKGAISVAQKSGTELDEKQRELTDEVAHCKSAITAVQKVGADLSDRHRELTEEVSYCKVMLKAVEKMSADMDAMRRDMSYLKGSLDIVRSGGRQLMQSHSPISLTSEGEAVVAEMGARGIVDGNWGRIVERLDRMGAASPYDIQQECLEGLSVEPECYLDEGSLAAVKDYAFRNGEPLQLYLRVIGLLVRDRYLAHLGVPLSRIDETAPSK